MLPVSKVIDNRIRLACCWFLMQGKPTQCLIGIFPIAKWSFWLIIQLKPDDFITYIPTVNGVTYPVQNGSIGSKQTGNLHSLPIENIVACAEFTSLQINYGIHSPRFHSASIYLAHFLIENDWLSSSVRSPWHHLADSSLIPQVDVAMVLIVVLVLATSL